VEDEILAVAQRKEKGKTNNSPTAKMPGTKTVRIERRSSKGNSEEEKIIRFSYQLFENKKRGS